MHRGSNKLRLNLFDVQMQVNQPNGEQLSLLQPNYPAWFDSNNRLSHGAAWYRNTVVGAVSPSPTVLASPTKGADTTRPKQRLTDKALFYLFFAAGVVVGTTQGLWHLLTQQAGQIARRMINMGPMMIKRGINLALESPRLAITTSRWERVVCCLRLPDGIIVCTQVGSISWLQCESWGVAEWGMLAGTGTALLCR